MQSAMGLTLTDLEKLAEWAYRAAGLEPDTPAAPLELARLLIAGGSHVPVARCTELRTPARLARVGSQWRIYVRASFDDTAMRWLVAHECAEWILARENYRGTDIEQKAESLAARLIAPRPAARIAIDAGLDFQELAEAFGMSQSSAALRRGEVSREPTALITPEAVYLRGDDWAWGDDTAIRQIATAASTPGIVRARCTDNVERTALRRVVGA